MKTNQPVVLPQGKCSRMFFCADCKYYQPYKNDPSRGICVLHYQDYKALSTNPVFDRYWKVSESDENCKDFVSEAFR